MMVPGSSGLLNQIVTPSQSSTVLGSRFDTGGLFLQYSKYRIVAYGARLRSLQSSVSTNGEYTIAVLPVKGLVNPLAAFNPSVTGGDNITVPVNSYWGAASPRSTIENMLRHMGLPVSGTDNSAVIDLTKLVNIPQHAVISASEVAARGCHVRGLPFEGDARTYRNTTYSSIGTDSMDVATVLGTSGNAGSNIACQQYGVDMSPWKVGGHESIIIGGAGFPANTLVGAVELIYHIEAIPNPNFSLLARPTGSIPRAMPSTTLDQVLTLLHKLPRISFADTITAAGDAMIGDLEGRVGSAAARGLGTLGGMLTRLMISSV